MLDFCLQKELIPGSAMRLAIDYLLKKRLRDELRAYVKSNGQNKMQLIAELKQSDIALSTDTANDQHYQVPSEFFQLTLGPKLKYSCCSWNQATTLAQAETEMLELYCQRAQLSDGQTILDLGCGWGSLSLYLAEKYTNSNIIAVSNSATQKAFIDQVAQQRGLSNLEVITQDVNQLTLDKTFDRIISIEMFEHIRNYQQLLDKLTDLLNDSGKLFVHYFCHHHLIYPFNSDDSWMAKHFFQDGLMPSEDLLLHFQDAFILEQRWRVNGEHYAKTCYAWLENLLSNKAQILTLFNGHYPNQEKLRFHQWQLFFRACAQLFAYNNGNEWFVSHYLLQKRSSK